LSFFAGDLHLATFAVDSNSAKLNTKCYFITFTIYYIVRGGGDARTFIPANSFQAKKNRTFIPAKLNHYIVL